MMNNKSMLLLIALFALATGFIVGVYQSGTSGSNIVKADPYDEPWYGYGMYNNSNYGTGMGMGMGMCMSGPMGGYGMYNGSQYSGLGMNGYGYGMYNNSYSYGGMGMMGGYGMMGPMMGNSYSYAYNKTGYMGMGGCPMMGMMGGYNSMYNYPYQNSAPQSLVDYNGQVVSLADSSPQKTDTQNTTNSPSTSPLLIVGIAIAVLALAPLSWKILQKYKK